MNSGTMDFVLICDDEPDAVEPLVRIFKREGFEAVYVSNGAEALATLKKTPFQLILMDVMMPGMTGYEVVKKLQEDDTTSSIPVIFVTGHFNPDEIVKGLEVGGVDAISKPFHIAEVLTRSKLRIAEAKLKMRYTPIAHFFAEAQEKEQSRRTGEFEFFDKQKNKIGDIYLREGKVVYSTSKDAIKEDAFLQLASMKNIRYVFTDASKPPKETLSVNVTSLILEASKIVDELDAKEIRDEDQKRIIVIDRDRIPRILASRALKTSGYQVMVTSPDEISQDIFSKFFPDAVVIDPVDCDMILNKVSLTNSENKAIPVIVYGDHDQLDEFAKLNQSGSYNISAFVDKAQTNQSLAHAVFQALK